MRSPSGGTSKVIIVGAGLGGLLTAAYLSGLGREVVVLEALDILGGRFTHLDYEGFAVPTGAFHMLPGGTTGPLFQCLQRVGLTVPLVEPRPAFTVVSEGTRHALDLSGLEGGGTGLLRALGIASKRRLQARIALVAALGAVGGNLSAAAMVAG
ncbi:MAG: NAD(P)-binding protein, partial [Armatimonadota bacterium]